MMKRCKIDDVIGTWKIVEKDVKNSYWKVKCAYCGSPSIKRKPDMRYSCRCVRGRIVIELGLTIGYWKVLEIVSESKVLCICTGCNKVKKEILNISLYARQTKSCGCMKKELMKQANMTRYGVENSFQSEEVKDAIKQTNLGKYGVENPSQSEEIKEKKRQICQEKYGVNSYLQLEEVRTKAKQACLEKFGVEHYFQLDAAKEQIKQIWLDGYGVEHPSQLCEYKYRLRDWGIENPEKLNPSIPELEILAFIHQYYPSAHKIRKGGYELDIFIPELNLGIEHNGLFHHCEFRKDKNYHLNKSNYYKSNNVRVIHIWGHEWQTRQNQVKSFLLSAISKNEYKIGARKCSFLWSSSEDEVSKAQELLENTHIQGKASNPKYVCNVYHEDILVATAAFGLHHRNSSDWILSRFTTKINYTIQGCLSKISKLAHKNLRVPIVSWADYRLSNGNGYEKAGWQCKNLSPPDYFYYKNGNKIISKQSRQKKVVGTPKGMTEREHAELDGLKRIYDCGKIRFVYRE